MFLDMALDALIVVYKYCVRCLLVLVDFYGQYDFVTDLLVGSSANDRFFPGKGPAVLAGGPGRDEASLPYTFSDVVDAIDLKSGHIHLRILADDFLGTSIDVELIGVEKLAFVDRLIDLRAAPRALRDPNVIFGDYEFVADTLTGNNVNASANFFLPGSGDAFVSGDLRKQDVLSIQADLKAVTLKKRRDGSGFVAFSDQNGDGSHVINFTAIDRLEFNNAVFSRSRKGKWSAKSIGRLV